MKSERGNTGFDVGIPSFIWGYSDLSDVNKRVTLSFTEEAQSYTELQAEGLGEFDVAGCYAEHGIA